MIACPTCGGCGMVEVFVPSRYHDQESPEYGTDDCWDCKGTGTVPDNWTPEGDDIG